MLNSTAGRSNKSVPAFIRSANVEYFHKFAMFQNVLALICSQKHMLSGADIQFRVKYDKK